MLTMKWFMGEQDDLTDAHAVRRAVFMEEQGVPEEIEMDGTDGSCIHLVLYDENIPVSTGRILLGHDTSDDPANEEFLLGRIATVMTHRGRGLGQNVMRSLISACCMMGGTRQVVHAQVSARGFYEGLGFTAFGEEYNEADIPHISMEHFGNAQTESKCGSCGTCGAHKEGGS